MGRSINLVSVLGSFLQGDAWVAGRHLPFLLYPLNIMVIKGRHCDWKVTHYKIFSHFYKIPDS